MVDKLVQLGVNDLVAAWQVQLADGVHLVEFEHGTTSGRRTVRVDGAELVKKDWMFKLVGSESFRVGPVACLVKIEPVGGFSYQYTLEVNGKAYKKFVEEQTKALRTWVLPVEGQMCRVVLERDTLDVWVNGRRAETAGEFADDFEGTETHFTIRSQPAYIRALSSGNKRVGIVHKLFVQDSEVPEYVEK